jgi:hypothetical protein
MYGFDGMFLRTVKDLTIRPGKVAGDFINGNRVKYFGPVGYFFFMVSIYLLIASILGVDLYAFTEASNAFNSPEANERDLQHSIVVLMNDNMRLISLAVVISMIFFTWLFFRKSGYNFIETTVLIFLVQGHAVWLSIFSVVSYKVFDYAWDGFLILFVSNVYILFGFIDLYSFLPRLRVVVKGLLVLMCSYAVFFALVVVGILLYLSFHPEIVEKIKSSRTL